MKFKKVLAGITAAALVVSAAVMWQENRGGAAAKLAAPVITSTSSTTDSVTLNWNKVKGAKGYFVYQLDEKLAKFKKVKDLKARTVTITGLESEKEYSFKVAAYKKKNGKKIVQKKSGVVTVATEAKEEIKAGTDLDGITVYDADGKAVALSELTGKPMIINCWATWCGPCKRELPHFQKYYEKYKDEIHFVMIDVWEQKEEQGEIEAYVKDEGYTFPVYFDWKNEAEISFKLEAIPLTVAVNAEGKIVDSINYSLSEEELVGLIEKIR